MPRDEGGWQVMPAPDGRGMPEQTPKRPPPHRRPGFLWFVLILIAVNWLSVLLFRPSTGQQRVTLSFNPFFLQAVQAGEVKWISPTGHTVERTLKVKLRYPPSNRRPPATTPLRPDTPTFLND